MKIKFLPCILFCLILALPNIIFAQKKAPIKPTPTPSNRELTQPKAMAEKRLALVLGNANYQFAGKLRNPVNDARDMATSLRNFGFTVIDGYDITLSQMEEKVQQFGEKLKAQKGVGLVYYAGHGLQFNGSNYLIPVDANIKSEQETKYKGLNLGLILDTLDNASNGFNLIILDACRNNPFARSWNRDAGTSGGLAQTNAPSGTFIAYATAPGSVAADGTGRNGTFTAELLNQIQTPNLTVEQVFKNVRTNVLKQTNSRQTPWDSSSLVGDFYFSGKGNATANNSNPIVQSTPRPIVETVTRPSTPTRSIPSSQTIETNFQSNLFDDVIRDAKIFLENEPANARVNALLGLSLTNKKQITEAVPYLERAIALGSEISLGVFRLKKIAFFNNEFIKDGFLSLSKDEFGLKIGKESYTAKFSQLKEVKLGMTLSKDFAVYVKGDFLYTEGEGSKQKQKIDKDRELVIVAPQATTQQILVGKVQYVVAVCKDCETWTKEIVRIINHCRTGELQNSVGSQPTEIQNDKQPTKPVISTSVPTPAETYFKFTNDKFAISIPTNWRNLQSGDGVFAPENASGSQGISHGVLIIFFKPTSNNLSDVNRENIQSILSGNPYLSKETETVPGIIDGRPSLITGLSGLSPITKTKEMVFLYSTLLKDKRLLTFAFVCPADEMTIYTKTIQSMTTSISLKN